MSKICLNCTFYDIGLIVNENTIDSMSNLRAQSLQEKFHHRLAAHLCYQRSHKVTSITKNLSFHIHFTVYVLNIDFLYMPYFKNS